MIQAFGAGIDKVDLAAVRERGDIFVCNSHINAAEVAEYAVMLLLALTKNIIVNDRELRKGNWEYGWGGPSPNIEIRRKRALIIGLGNVGSELAKRLRCFDLHVTAVTRSGQSPHSHLVDRLNDPTSLPQSVPLSDFVFLTLPLTRETHGLVDDEFVSWMKESSILVNISRAAIVVGEALFRALEEKRIRGAALDVWWDYPREWGGSGVPPSEHFPFHELDNIVVSPHRAAYSEHIMRDQIRFVGKNLLRFTRGEKPLNIIDIDLGY
jgi:phosphoglycerate dehydrogenase-like enzyme